MILEFSDAVLRPFGHIVLAVVALCLAMGALGGGVVAVSRRFANATRRNAGVMALLFLIQVMGLSWHLGRGVREFDRLVIEQDGTWRLKNYWGYSLSVLPPDILRAVHVHEDRRYPLIRNPNIRPRIQTWVEIELPDGRTFVSTRSPVAVQRPAIAWLQAWIVLQTSAPP